MARREPRRRRVRLFAFTLGDVVFGGILGLAAAGSVGFPVYVHLNPDRFGPPRMEFTGSEIAAAPLSDADVERRTRALVRPQLDLDRVMTGSAPAATDRFARRIGPQAFPGEGFALSVMFATSGRALVVDGGRVDVVMPGSVLSDGSTVVSIRRRGSAWAITTSRDQVFTWASRD